MCEIDNEKAMIRKEALAKRRQMDSYYKAKLDSKIFDRLISLEAFISANIVLIYVSTEIEVDTHRIIDYCLSDNKKIAVPKCGKFGHMDFYRINSMKELVEGFCKIPEPLANPEKMLTNFKNALCIVPALCFDKNCFRIGYGGGFYDRFLEKNSIASVGLCYSGFIYDKLVSDIHDKRTDYVVTDEDMITAR